MGAERQENLPLLLVLATSLRVNQLFWRVLVRIVLIKESCTTGTCKEGIENGLERVALQRHLRLTPFFELLYDLKIGKGEGLCEQVINKRFTRDSRSKIE